MSSSDAVWPNPFSPAGCIDVKITTTDLAKERSFYARFGRACGMAFDANEFLKDYPQWEWQREILVSRPSQPWVFFTELKEIKNH